jgi:hypothetical protein
VPRGDIVHWKHARTPGSGVVAFHESDGLLSYGGRLDDGRWIHILVTAEGRGAYAVAATDGAAKEQACDKLDLDKVRVLGGRFRRGEQA